MPFTYQTWNKNTTAAMRREMDAQNLLSSIIGVKCDHRLWLGCSTTCLTDFACNF